MALFLGKIRPWQWGVAAGVLTASVLLTGLVSCGESAAEIGLALVMSIGVGIGIFTMIRIRAYAWLTVFLPGLLLGLESAAELFWEVPFERQCFVALITTLFWLVLAFVVGALAEFIHSLHRLAHKIGGGVEERFKEHLTKMEK